MATGQTAGRLTLLLTIWLLIGWGSAWAVPVPVWIDTDPACGRGISDDVDDCWALAFALSSPELAVRGISTVFGNVDGPTTYDTALKVVPRLAKGATPPIYRGADHPLPEVTSRPKAVDALARALGRERLTILALGPLTNLAILLDTRPKLAKRIRRVVAVAGRPPNPGFAFRPGQSLIIHFHDLNFRKDVKAFERVLKAGVPITLMPFEATTQVTILPEHLDALRAAGGNGAWLANMSDGWMSFWDESLRSEGFHPFDALAVGVVVAPRHFNCPPARARINRGRSRFVTTRDRLEVSDELSDGFPVRYCKTVRPPFRPLLIKRVSRK